MYVQRKGVRLRNSEWEQMYEGKFQLLRVAKFAVGDLLPVSGSTVKIRVLLVEEVVGGNAPPKGQPRLWKYTCERVRTRTEG